MGINAKFAFAALVGCGVVAGMWDLTGGLTILALDYLLIVLVSLVRR